MPYESQTFRILVASPGDVQRERTVVARAIDEWNLRHADHLGIQLQTILWEERATPEVGGDPQSIINRRLVETSDIVIGVFGARIGSKTPRAESGTVEEIREMVNAGKPALVYFSVGPIPRDRIDFDQLARLDAFKKTFKKDALIGEFKSSSQFRKMIERDITEMVYRLVPPARGYVAGSPTYSSAAEAPYLGQPPGAKPAPEADRSLKACLAIERHQIGFRHDGIYVLFRMTNEGAFDARYVTVDMSAESNTGERPIHRSFEIAKLGKGSPPQPVEFKLPRYLGEDPPREMDWLFTIRIQFSDGLDERDEAVFVFRMTGKDPNAKVELDRSATKVSRLCGFLNPNAVAVYR